ncbi:MAG: RnfABCDGE type electron transport complex subunit D [Bacteroidales bacterium]
MSEKEFYISPSPHIRSSESTKSIMLTVVIAMLPAVAWSVYAFGMSALTIMLTAVVSCVLFEYLIDRFLMNNNSDGRSVLDLSAVVTGILLGFNLPSTLPIWIVMVGALFAMGVAKMSFGGLGTNLFNPALAGRVFLLISFPAPMTSWVLPVDGTTGATPLGLIKEAMRSGDISSVSLPSLTDMFFGLSSGSLGEVSALMLIIGGVYMLSRKVITWHIPVSVLGSIVILSGILWLINPNLYMNPLTQVLSGGAMLGAIFMATDMVTSPMTQKGQIIFGVGIGILTVCIRAFGSYPEGISFAILLMNAAVPLINKYVKPSRFGK